MQSAGGDAIRWRSVVVGGPRAAVARLRAAPPPPAVLLPPLPPPSVEIVSPKTPPPPQAEVQPPAPPANMQYFYWDPGHWHWTGADWYWIAGHYIEKPYKNAYWVPGHWDQRPMVGRGYPATGPSLVDCSASSTTKPCTKPLRSNAPDPLAPLAQQAVDVVEPQPVDQGTDSDISKQREHDVAGGQRRRSRILGAQQAKDDMSTPDQRCIGWPE
jgi:hypothetical protein